MNPAKIQKTKHACIVEAHESTRKRLDFTPPKDHEDHIAGEGYNLISHYNLVHKISSDASSDEISRCEGSSVQGMEEARNDTSLVMGRDEEPKGMLFWKHQERGKWSTLPHLRDSVQLQTVMALCEQENIRNNEQPSCSRLKTTVTRHIDQMVRTRNFKARNERIETE